MVYFYEYDGEIELDDIMDDYEVVEDEESLDKDDTECPRCSGGCNYCLMTSY